MDIDIIIVYIRRYNINANIFSTKSATPVRFMLSAAVISSLAGCGTQSGSGESSTAVQSENQKQAESHTGRAVTGGSTDLVMLHSAYYGKYKESDLLVN